MTDTDQEGETHEPQFELPPVDELNDDDNNTQADEESTGEMIERLEAEDRAEDERQQGASALELELEAATDPIYADDTSLELTQEEEQARAARLINELDKASRYEQQEQFFPRFDSQWVVIRHATRVAQSINAIDPDFLSRARASGQPQVEIENLFGRARAACAAVFSLVNAAIGNMEKAEPVEQVRARRGSQNAKERTEQLLQNAAGARQPQRPQAVAPHHAAQAPLAQPSRPTAPPDPMRQKVLDAQRRQEAQRQRDRERRANTSQEPRVAPQLRRQAAADAPHDDDRAKLVQRATTITREANAILQDLRGRKGTISKDRVDRFCGSILRLAEAGLVPEQLSDFAKNVKLHQNAKNVAKLATATKIAIAKAVE